MTSPDPRPWHPVTPRVDDPDLVPPAGPAGAGRPSPESCRGAHGGGGGPPPQPADTQRSFFAEHRFAVCVSAVVLVVFIVVLYIYLTRRGGDKGGKGAARKGGQPPPGGGTEGGDPAIPDNATLDELNRIRALRRRAPPGGPPGEQGPPPGRAPGVPARPRAPQQPPPPGAPPQQQTLQPQQAPPQQTQQPQQAPPHHSQLHAAPAGGRPAAPLAGDGGPYFASPPVNFGFPGGPQFRAAGPAPGGGTAADGPPPPTPRRPEEEEAAEKGSGRRTPPSADFPAGPVADGDLDELIGTLQDETDAAERGDAGTGGDGA